MKTSPKLSFRPFSLFARSTVAVMAALATFAFSPQTLAGSATWGTAGGGTWSDTANWGGNPVADGTDATADFNQVDIPAGTNTITLDTSRTIGNMIFGDTNTGTLGTWALNVGSNVLTLGVSAGSPTITTNVDTSITLNNSVAGGFTTTSGLTKNGTGTLTLSGSSSYSVSGTINVNAGTLSIGNGVTLGSGTMNLANGTTFRLNSSSVSQFPTNPIVVAASGTATYSAANSASGASSAYFGAADSVLNIGSSLSMTASGTAQFAGFLGTVVIPSGSAIRWASTSGANGNGGANTTFQIDGGMNSRNVGGAGGVVLGALTGGTGGNISGQTNTTAGTVNYFVGAKGIDTTYMGNFSNGANGQVNLIKTGTASLTLSGIFQSGTSVTTGTIGVTQGTLVFNGNKTTSGNIGVSSGATLKGSGTMAGLTSVASGGHIAPGASAVGTLTLGSLTLNSGSILDYEFNNTPANDQISVTTSGGLTLNGGGFNLYQEGGATQFTTSGSFNLISYSGALSGLLGNLSVLNPASGKSYSFGNTGSLITLTIGDISNFVWKTDADGSWGTAGNWDVNSVPNSTAATAIFSGTATAPRTISLNGDKTVGGITFDNANGYTIAQGSSGSLILSASTGNANVIVNSGSGHAISAPVSLTSSAVFSIPNAADALTVSGAVTGGGALTKSGSGTLVLSASNSYSGGTTLSSGTVQIGANSSFGSNSSVSVTGNSTIRSGAASLAPTYNFAISNGAVGTVDTNGNDMSLSGTVSGLGGVGKTGLGTLTLSASNTYSGVTTVNTGVLKLANANAAQNSIVTVNVDNGLGFGSGITNFTIAGLSGSNAVVLQDDSAAAVQLTVGNTTASYSGALSGSGSVVKTGAGTQTFNAVSSYSGGTRIDAGTLTVNINGGAGAGDVTLNGGTFRFGNIGNSAVTLGNNFIVNAPSTISSSTKSNGFSGTLSGTANLTLGSDNTGFFTPGGSWAAYSGTASIQSNSGNMTFRMDTNFDAPNSVTNASGSVTMTYKNGTSFTHTINFGSLNTVAGSTIGGSAGGSGTIIYAIGSLGLDSTLAGTITDGGTHTGLTKSGTGTLTISGINNTYTGAVNINAGVLSATTSNLGGTGAASALGAMNVARNINVNNGGTLRFDSGDVFSGSGIAPAATLVINAGGLVTNNGASFNTLGPVTLNGGTLTGVGGSTNTQFQMYNLTGLVTVGGTSASTISGAGTTVGGGDGTTTVGYHLNGPITFNVADATGSDVSDLNVSATLIDGVGATPVAGGITKTGAGTMTLSASNTYTGATTVNGGTLNLVQSLNASSAFNLTSGTAVLTAHTGGVGNIKHIDTSALTMSGTGALDLTNNALVVRNGNLAAITAAIVTGANGGVWNGPGLASSTAGADANHITTLGASTAAAQGLTGGSFAGVAGLSGSDVLVKYTYYGDANFSGTVTGADYGAIDTGFGAHLTGWENGDFNLDGVVTGADYGAIDTAFGLQGGVVLAQGGGASSQAAAVPEPGTVGLMLLGAAGLLWGKRRKHHAKL